MNPIIQKRLINIVAILGLVSVNLLADAIPLNGLTTYDILSRFDISFMPERYVFVIIPMTHLALAVYAIYQALPEQYTNRSLNRVGYYFAMSCAANIAWIIFWHYELFLLATLAMFALVITLSIAYLRLGVRRAKVMQSMGIAVHIPFSLYLAWSTMATIGQVAVLLNHYRWRGWGISPELWAVVLLTLTVLLGLQVSITRRDVTFQLVLIWCVIGVLVKQSAVFVVAISAMIAVFVLLIILVMGVLIKRRDTLLGD